MSNFISYNHAAAECACQSCVQTLKIKIYSSTSSYKPLFSISHEHNFEDCWKLVPIEIHSSREKNNYGIQWVVSNILQNVFVCVFIRLKQKHEVLEQNDKGKIVIFG